MFLEAISKGQAQGPAIARQNVRAYLAEIFPGKSTSPVGTPTPVGVNNDLATGHACKFARRADSDISCGLDLVGGVNWRSFSPQHDEEWTYMELSPIIQIFGWN